MKEFKKSTNNNKFYHSPIFLFILFLIFILLVYKVFGLVKKEKESNLNKELILEQIEDLKKREENLSSEIKRLETEEGVERLIREKYQVAKEGEKMVIIVDEGTVASEEKEGQDNSFWFWLKNIFNKN